MEKNKQYKNREKDWIDYIVEEVYKYYNNRDIVLWGKYSVSDSIRAKLKERYGLDIAFYVENDITKIDNICIFPSSCLAGKASEYYVVVPLAFYPELKEQLIGGGYRRNLDYYYFCDCVIEQNIDRYEDSHGNKIIGKYQGIKFAFTGFNTIIEIGENAHFKNNVFYIHSDVRLTIGDNTNIQDSRLTVNNDVKIMIGDNVHMKDNVFVFKEGADAEFKNNFKTQNSKMTLGSSAHLEIGCRGRIDIDSEIRLGKDALLKIDNDFSAHSCLRLSIPDYTSIIIGKDCMFSCDVIMISNDSHSIFDLTTGKNVNSTYAISKDRKIVIGDHVWVGARSTILYNTEIGDGSIIGAASLVKGIIPSNCIAVGVPAKVIKSNVAWKREIGIETYV